MKRELLSLKLLRIACVLMTLAALAWASRSVSACPTCKEGLASDPQNAQLVKGYSYSIVFMITMPYLLLTSFGLYMYLEVRKARARNAAAQASAEIAPKKPLAPATTAAAPTGPVKDEFSANRNSASTRVVQTQAAQEQAETRELAEV